MTVGHTVAGVPRDPAGTVLLPLLKLYNSFAWHADVSRLFVEVELVPGFVD
jgi:hypothetical protein